MKRDKNLLYLTPRSQSQYWYKPYVAATEPYGHSPMKLSYHLPTPFFLLTILFPPLSLQYSLAEIAHIPGFTASLYHPEMLAATNHVSQAAESSCLYLEQSGPGHLNAF